MIAYFLYANYIMSNLVDTFTGFVTKSNEDSQPASSGDKKEPKRSIPGNSTATLGKIVNISFRQTALIIHITYIEKDNRE